MQQNTVKNDGMFSQMIPQRVNVGKQNKSGESGKNAPEPQKGDRCDPDDKSYKQPSLNEIWEWLGDADADAV